MIHPPEDSVCPACDAELTKENVLQVDVTTGDGPSVYVLYCVDCVLNNRAGREDD